MKTIVIMQDVSVSGEDGRGMPAFKKGQEVRIADSLADLLTKRGVAKEVKGKTRDEVEKVKPKENKEVQIKKLTK